EDVLAERALLEAGLSAPAGDSSDVSAPAAAAARWALAVHQLRKSYAARGGGIAPRPAVRDMSLSVEVGTALGLLGPNGAGKTTLISCLIGLMAPSAGVARVGGFDIGTEMDDVHRVIGICPQARLKGVPKKEERATVLQAMERMSLTSLQVRRAHTLSGGERRRLSIAIALVGNPTVVFLDEPTSTHSMEEAEAVCQRVGIMSKGTLRCLSSPTGLKQRYGAGFRLSLVATSAAAAGPARAFVEAALASVPGWAYAPGDGSGSALAIEVELPAAAARRALPELFGKLTAGAAENGVADWAVSQTTLEE
ncbi:hypothetical protein HK405_015286, partial [Cladochytrium tenue]